MVVRTRFFMRCMDCLASTWMLACWTWGRCCCIVAIEKDERWSVDVCARNVWSSLRAHKSRRRCTNCDVSRFLTMLGASLGGLDPAGWRCDEDGEIKTGEPQCNEEEEVADFVHSQSLKEGDVWRMQVVAGGGSMVGIAAERYDVEKMPNVTCLTV